MKRLVAILAVAAGTPLAVAVGAPLAVGTPLALAVGAPLAVGTPLAMAAGTPSPAASPLGNLPARAQLRGDSCRQALNPPDRSVSVKAVMRPLAGTRKLWLRFDLLEKASGSSTSQSVVRAGNLGVWLAPRNPTLGQLAGDVWVLNSSVVNLDAPASYRFRVSFRWTGAHGHVLGSAVRYSSRCVQRELRPDLLVRSIAVRPVAGSPDQARYTAVIANRGATGAGPFEVLFTPGDGSAPQSRLVSFLGPGQTLTRLFTGPACNAADPPTVTADASDEVDDYDRANNQLAAVCPAPAAP